MTTAPPTRRGGRSRLRLVAAIVAIVVVYGAVVTLFASHQSAEVRLADPSPDDPGAMTVALEPRGVDAAGRELDLLITPDAGTGPLASGDGLTLDEPMSLVVSPTNGERQLDVDEGRIVASESVRIPFADGDVDEWPFDSYRVTAVIVPTHDTGDESEPIATSYTAGGSVAGWTFDIEIVPADAGTPPLVEITAHRPLATVAFAIVLLALMIALPVLALTVAISTYRGTRQVEATLLGWLAAMLFAIVPLRGFLPNAPPIGSWVDYLVVLWVIVGLVAALVVFAAGWMRWSRPASDEPRW